MRMGTMRPMTLESFGKPAHCNAAALIKCSACAYTHTHRYSAAWTDGLHGTRQGTAATCGMQHFARARRRADLLFSAECLAVLANHCSNPTTSTTAAPQPRFRTSSAPASHPFYGFSGASVKEDVQPIIPPILTTSRTPSNRPHRPS